MAVLKNKTQSNFTIINNNIFQNKELSLKDIGLLCMLFRLPDSWIFSVAGLCTLVTDGKDSINASLKKLEQLGYIVITKTRKNDGTFKTEIEVFSEKVNPDVQAPNNRRGDTKPDESKQENRCGFFATDNPQRENRDGFSVTVYPQQYNINNTKTDIKTDYSKSINLSWGEDAMDRESDEEIVVENLKKQIAENIKHKTQLASRTCRK